MLIHNGTQERVIEELTSGPGTKSVHGSVQSDSLLVSLYVSQVTSGTLSVTIYTLIDEGKEVPVITFPNITAPTAQLLLRKSAVVMQRFRVAVTYSGACEYSVYVRAIEGAGESTTKILGNSDWSVAQATVGTTAVQLVPSSLTDRNGVVIKNWSETQTLYLANSLALCTSGVGYPLAPRDGFALDIAAGASIWAIASAPGADVRIAQSGG
jgi:hypothetical protein